VIGLGAHDKKKAYTGGMGIETQNMIAFDVPTTEELIRKP
jgi:hypothetical protein